MDSDANLSTQERFKRGAADANSFFHYVADFIGFTDADAEAIRETQPVIEKHIPDLVSDFYSQLLSFPATRKIFCRPDGTVDQPYLEMRMQHQVSFWRRTAMGDFNDDYARFIDYVGRAHTSHGADPTIYIAERYVIGMVAFIGQRIRRVLTNELRAIDPDLERRGTEAWSELLMVLLELLVRPYSLGREPGFEPRQPVNKGTMHALAVESYERALGIARRIEKEDFHVGRADAIPEGGRLVIDAGGISIGVFHQDGKWFALQNSCLHRGGPVCTGELSDGTLTCPWHGYQYELSSGQLLFDRNSALPKYPVVVWDGEVYVQIPHYIRDEAPVSLKHVFDGDDPAAEEVRLAAVTLKPNEFRTADVQPGQMKQVMLDKTPVAVYNIGGVYYATDDKCTHTGAPLSTGRLDGIKVTCPWHGSCFDITTGEVLQGPARRPLGNYHVAVRGDIGFVEAIQ